MPLILYVLGGTFAVLVGLWRVVAWLARVRVITWQRVLVAHLLLALVLVSLLFTPMLYVVPKTVWPPMVPEMTWLQAADWLGEKLPSGESRYSELGFRLWRERPPEFWLTQIPLMILSLPLLSGKKH